MTYRVIRDGIHSQIFATDEDPRISEDVFETFEAAQNRLLRYLKDRRDTLNHVIFRIESTTATELKQRTKMSISGKWR